MTANPVEPLAGAARSIAGTGLDHTLTAAQQAEVTTAGAKATEGRQNITLVCGMLMLVYGIEADAAFKVLAWRSQETNSKLKAPADQILEEIMALPREGPPDTTDRNRRGADECAHTTRPLAGFVPYPLSWQGLGASRAHLDARHPSVGRQPLAGPQHRGSRSRTSGRPGRSRPSCSRAWQWSEHVAIPVIDAPTVTTVLAWPPGSPSLTAVAALVRSAVTICCTALPGKEQPAISHPGFS